MLVITQNGEVCKVDASSALRPNLRDRVSVNDEVESWAGHLVKLKSSLSNDQEPSATSRTYSAKTVPRGARARCRDHS